MPFLLKKILDKTFSNHQFKIHGYKQYRRDRNKHGGGTFCYTNENFPWKAATLEKVSDDCKITLIEFFIKTRKWLRIGVFELPSIYNMILS